MGSMFRHNRLKHRQSKTKEGSKVACLDKLCLWLVKTIGLLHNHWFLIEEVLTVSAEVLWSRQVTSKGGRKAILRLHAGP